MRQVCCPHCGKEIRREKFGEGLLKRRFSPQETVVLKILIEAAGGVATYDYLAGQVFTRSRANPLIGLSKIVGQLRIKLQVTDYEIVLQQGVGYRLARNDNKDRVFA